MFLGALFLIGTAISAYGQISSANSSAEAQRADAAAKREQAGELLERQAINERIMQEQSERQQSAAGSGSAMSGLEGTSLGSIMTIRKTTLENIALSRRDAEFKAKLLRQGADVQTELASDMMTAGYISGAGTLLQSGLSAQKAGLFDAPSMKTSSLGKA
jgi:hypothetical protein